MFLLVLCVREIIKFIIISFWEPLSVVLYILKYEVKKYNRVIYILYIRAQLIFLTKKKKKRIKCCYIIIINSK